MKRGANGFVDTSFLADLSAFELSELRLQIDKLLGDDKWFGIVRWCDDDIRSALKGAGYNPTDDAVDIIRVECENNHHFTDNMISAGWDTISEYIAECEEELEAIGGGDTDDESTCRA